MQRNTAPELLFCSETLMKSFLNRFSIQIQSEVYQITKIIKQFVLDWAGLAFVCCCFLDHILSYFLETWPLWLQSEIPEFKFSGCRYIIWENEGSTCSRVLFRMEKQSLSQIQRHMQTDFSSTCKEFLFPLNKLLQIRIEAQIVLWPLSQPLRLVLYHVGAVKFNRLA